MPTVKLNALTILAAVDEARSEIIGKAVVLTDGKAGTVGGVWLDEQHGLRIMITGHSGPSQRSNSRSRMKAAETDGGLLIYCSDCKCSHHLRSVQSASLIMRENVVV